MKLQDRQELFARNIVALITHIFGLGFKCTLGEAFRTEEQAKIYAKQGKGIVDSLHCKRLAVDLNIFSLNGTYLIETELYKPFGEFWESLHPDNVWGGRWTKRADGNHFQMNEEST